METYDDGSSGPYVNGNVSVYTYYQWTDITSAQTVYCDFILELDTILLKKSIGIVKILSKIFLLIRMECLLIM